MEFSNSPKPPGPMDRLFSAEIDNIIQKSSGKTTKQDTIKKRNALLGLTDFYNTVLLWPNNTTKNAFIGTLTQSYKSIFTKEQIAKREYLQFYNMALKLYDWYYQQDLSPEILTSSTLIPDFNSDSLNVSTDYGNICVHVEQTLPEQALLPQIAIEIPLQITDSRAFTYNPNLVTPTFYFGKNNELEPPFYESPKLIYVIAQDNFQPTAILKIPGLYLCEPYLDLSLSKYEYDSINTIFIYLQNTGNTYTMSYIDGYQIIPDLQDTIEKYIRVGNLANSYEVMINDQLTLKVPKKPDQFLSVIERKFVSKEK